MGWLLVSAGVLGILGFWLLIRSRIARLETGLPEGRVAYVDTGAWNRCEQPLFSRRYRLVGRPDYLLRTRGGLVPVEVKSGPAPPQPYGGHILQLAAYCLLVEEQEGPSPHGILKYDNRAFEVDFTPGLRAELLHTLDSMRRDLRARDVDCSHEEPGRCRGCGYRDRCDRRLA